MLSILHFNLSIVSILTFDQSHAGAVEVGKIGHRTDAHQLEQDAAPVPHFRFRPRLDPTLRKFLLPQTFIAQT